MKTSELIECVKQVLERALTSTTSSSYNEIKTVLESENKTYKYVLITALAAKAADDSVNPLCLQTGSELEGAYDARTICHKAILDFEREYLGKALGGSNEPFLNKPARYPHLSKDNPSKGASKQILNLLCDFLPTVDTQDKAFDCLVYAVALLQEKKRELEELLSLTLVNDNHHESALLLSLVEELLADPREGESLTLVVAGLYYLYLQSITSNYKVEVHPVNQCGASSKEISDLDVYKEGELYIANELKDKDFSLTDVQHAVDKAKNAGLDKMFFIAGKHSEFDEDEIRPYVEDLRAEDFVLTVIDIDVFAPSIISLTSSPDVNDFIRFLLSSAYNNKFSQQTLVEIKEIAVRHVEVGWSN